jgi:ribosomal protein S18 acetylase RimI-like enzyme
MRGAPRSAYARFVAVTLEPMTPETYERWLGTTIAAYAADKVRVGTWTADEALDRSRLAFDELLPLGMETPGHQLRSVVTEEGETVGALWFAPTDRMRGEVAFIYDIEIDAAVRGRGYGRAALEALEPLARTLGYDAIGLHVFGDNEVARGLYRSAGFVETDVVMRKPIG